MCREQNLPEDRQATPPSETFVREPLPLGDSISGVTHLERLP